MVDDVDESPDVDRLDVEGWLPMLGQMCPEASVDAGEFDDELEVVVVVCACAGRIARRPTMAKSDSVATSRASFLLVTRLVFNSDSPPAATGCVEYLEDFRDGSLINPESVINWRGILISAQPTFFPPCMIDT